MFISQQKDDLQNFQGNLKFSYRDLITLQEVPYQENVFGASEPYRITSPALKLDFLFEIYQVYNKIGFLYLRCYRRISTKRRFTYFSR